MPEDRKTTADAGEQKYGAVTTERGRFHEGEPVIIFRAADMMIVELIIEYALRCYRAGSPFAHVSAVLDRAKLFLEWQAANEGKVKLPD